jgi:hypothetical protein
MAASIRAQNASSIVTLAFVGETMTVSTAKYASAKIEHRNVSAAFRTGTQEIGARATERGRNE